MRITRSIPRVRGVGTDRKSLRLRERSIPACTGHGATARSTLELHPIYPERAGRGVRHLLGAPYVPIYPRAGGAWICLCSNRIPCSDRSPANAGCVEWARCRRRTGAIHPP